MSNYLFLFTIGPVQGFIAQARKTQDLYAGSRILSALVLAGIDAFEQAFPGSEIKFPTFDRNVENLSLPNRFIGKLKTDDKEGLEKKADSIRNAVKKTWKEIAMRALKKSGVIAPEGFEDQIKAHLDIHWIFKEIDNSFAEAYMELERLGGAVKNVRPFAQYEYAGMGEAGRKCSIDGVNNALFYRRNEGKTPAFLEHAVPVSGFMLNPGEGLSSVSLVKRFYENVSSFPSTAEVALMHDESKLDEQQKDTLQLFKKLFSNNNEEIALTCLGIFNKKLADQIEINEFDKWNTQFDYQMLFEENLISKNIENSKQLGLLRKLQNRLKAGLKTKYYALILFDGDKMGKWLSGKNTTSIGTLESFHKTLSGALSQFGDTLQTYLDDTQGYGRTVYAGGDDFLGFVNVHHLFEVMQRLREEFNEKVNKAITDFKQSDKQLTFSAGIVIAHYKTPFSEILKNARNIEKKAKKEGGRNAFGITVIKHSGEVQEAIYKWDTNEQSPADCDNWQAMSDIVGELDKDTGHFSNTFIQNLSTEFFQLTGADLFDIDTTSRSGRHLENALIWEMKRLIGRALDKPENTQKDEQRKEDLFEAVKRLWENAPKPNKVRHFVHALQIADFLTRKTTQEK